MVKLRFPTLEVGSSVAMAESCSVVNPLSSSFPIAERIYSRDGGGWVVGWNLSSGELYEAGGGRRRWEFVLRSLFRASTREQETLGAVGSNRNRK